MDSKKGFCGLVLLLLNTFLANAAIYVSDPIRSKMLELRSNNQPCRIISNGESIRNVMRQTNPSYIHMVSSQELIDLSRSCATSQVAQSGGFIYPGTKWCGPGNIASSYDDLGVRADEDRCCRDHDHCPMSLEPGQCRRGICNISPFTRSHCDCDIAFKKCLREVNSRDSRLIGNIYFNIAVVTCFRDRRSCPQWMSLRQACPIRDLNAFASLMARSHGRFVVVPNACQMIGNDLSYTWFCEEWKFVPMDNYVQSSVAAENETAHANEIPDETRRKPLEHSKIDDELHVLYRTDSDIEKIMDNPKSTSKKQ